MIVLSAVVERLQYWFTADIYSQLITEKDVKSPLDRLSRVLNDEEAIYKHMRNENFKKQVKKLEKILYEIEDLVESHKVGVASRYDASFFLRMRRVSNSNFRARLRFLTKAINGILDFFKIYNLVPAGAPETGQGSSSSRDNVGGRSLPPTSTIVGEQWDGEDTIRMERDGKILLSALTEGSERVAVVSICGMGGIGKTTLAKTLYSNPNVRKHFDVSVWVTVSQEFRTRDIFLSILSQPRQLESDLPARTNDMVLAYEVYRCLKRRKWLVVLDDVWSIEVWESIKLVFPDDKNGSRILVTTRKRVVAECMSNAEHIHFMKFLNEDQSWELFKGRAQLTDSKLDSEWEQITKKIVRQSDGLPLAIVVLAGIFKTTPFDQWKSLLQDSEVEISKPLASEALTRPMDLIYNGLPSVLKPCLLYMGTFPEGSKIEADAMCQLWIAEGLVSEMQCKTKGKTTMELAGDYFNNLASRNLVQVSEEEMSTHQSFRYGCLHGLVRDTCKLKAKEEEFFEIVKLGHADVPKDSVLRLAIYFHKHEEMDILSFIGYELRSLLFFNSDHQSGEDWIRHPLEIPGLRYLKWIRILHFDGVCFRDGTLPPGVENLVLLRHLSLRDCYLKKLPRYIGDLLLLITLDLRVKNSCEVIIPNVLWKLRKLKHLYLPLKFQTHGKLHLDDLTALEILENFDAGICNAGDILNLTRLRNLTVSSEGNLEDLEQVFKCIEGNANHLSKTSLDIRNFESYTDERLAFIEKLFSCPVLHILRLEGRIGKTPKLDAADASFIEIYLNGSELEDDPMQILGGLPNLRILVLECEAYIGKQMCSNSGFTELRSLKLSNLYNLESWEMKTDAMPKLSTLTIENCRKMQKLPKELGRINALRKVKINVMSEEFVDGLREVVDGNGGENLNKINTNCIIEFGGRLLKTTSFESKITGFQIPSSTGTSDLASTSSGPPPSE